MCLIIKTDKDLPISQPLMTHWLSRNRDGWGMMWLKDNTVQVHRSMNKDELWDKYQELLPLNPIIHLRWRTHGDTDLENCHPYYCGHGIFLMHNGVLGDAGNHTPTKSDTWHFIEDWIKNFFSLVPNPHQAMRSKAFRHILEKAIGSGNRIVMGDRGGFVYFNEPAWHTIDNVNTGVKGLLVSNAYAWDATGYGKPADPYEHYGYGNHTSKWDVHKNHNPNPPPAPYHTGSYLKDPIKRIDGTYRNANGQIMTHVVGNIYIDQIEGAWLWTQGVFQRCPEIDKNIRKRIRKELKKNKGLIAIDDPQAPLLLAATAPASTSIIVVNDPHTDDEVAEAVIRMDQTEYNEILVKEWRKETTAAIHTKVYSEPEDAAIVLCALLGARV